MTMVATYAVLLLLLAVPLATANQSATSVVDQLRSAGYTGFIRLLEHADLVSEIESQVHSGETTLFVPSNDALMYRVSPALLAFLKAPANQPLLRQVLRFHVVTERISAFKWDGAHPTVEGSSPVVLRMDALAFYVSDVAVKQYNAIVMKDVVAHSINGLLVPRALESTLGGTGYAGAESGRFESDDEEEEGRRILQAAAAPSAPPSASPPPEVPTGPPSTPPPPPKSSARFVTGVRWTVSLVALFAVALLC